MQRLFDSLALVGGVCHGEQYAIDAEGVAGNASNVLDDRKEVFEAVQRSLLGLHRNDHIRADHQGIGEDQAQIRRAIQQHIIVLLDGQLPKQTLQDLLPVHHRDQIDVGFGQRKVRRDVVHALGMVADRLACCGSVNWLPGSDLPQQAAHRNRAALPAQKTRQVCLAVQVDAQHFLAFFHQGRPKIDDSGALADAAFLIGDSDDGVFLVHGVDPHFLFLVKCNEVRPLVAPRFWLCYAVFEVRPSVVPMQATTGSAGSWSPPHAPAVPAGCPGR